MYLNPVSLSNGHGGAVAHRVFLSTSTEVLAEWMNSALTRFDGARVLCLYRMSLRNSSVVGALPLDCLLYTYPIVLYLRWAETLSTMIIRGKGLDKRGDDQQWLGHGILTICTTGSPCTLSHLGVSKTKLTFGRC